MKWITHQCVALAAAVSLHMPAAGIAGVALGSVLPDMVDMRISRLTPNPQKTFNRIHRGASHWFGWYAALLLAAFVLPSLPHIPGLPALPSKDLYAVLAGIGFGALAHVLLDMLTPAGIPLHPFSRQKKLSLKLCSTGSIGEYVFLAVSLVVVALVNREHMPMLERVMRAVLH